MPLPISPLPAVPHAASLTVQSPNGSSTGRTQTDPPQQVPIDYSASAGQGTGQKGASEKPRRRLPPLGIEVGVFTPQSSRVRDRFGSAWTSFGIGFGALTQAKNGGSLGIDFDVYSHRRGDNYATIIPVGLEWRKAIGKLPAADNVSASVPYYRLGADVYGTRIHSIPDGVEAGYRFGYGGGGAVGVTFGRRAYLEARYRLVTKISGFDFSGGQLRAGVRF